MDEEMRTLFSLDIVDAINAAYADACDIIGIQGGDHAVLLRAAEHMPHLASMGETDPDIVCSKSVIAALA